MPNHTSSNLFESVAQGQLAKLKAEYAKDNRPSASFWQKLFGLPAYHWVLFSQMVVMSFFLTHLPFWLVGLAFLTIIAQFPKVKARFRYQKRLYQGIQMVGFLAGLVGLWLVYHTAFGLDVGVAFLFLCLAGKLWELYKKRDAYVVLNLSLFVLASLFLLDQGLLTTLQVIFGVLVIFFTFITLNDDGNTLGTGRLRSLGLLSLSAAPLLIILFLFFPRLPPLWSIQLSGQQATTGVSDSMSPGDFANLSQSTELAFRVEFEGQRPPQSQMYWRGLVFSDFDGVTWRPNTHDQSQWQMGNAVPNWLQSALVTINQNDSKHPSDYHVILEPTQQNWLFGLDYPLTEQKNISLTSNFTLQNAQPVTQQFRYSVIQYPSMEINRHLSEAERQINLQLPKSGNPKSQEFAKTLFAQSNHDPKEYIRRVREWITQGQFSYTLSPPRLHENRVDEFLFSSKAGFCEHYSSSFTYLMRAAGIPARVVAGYQGGELGRDGHSWEVRQMDAHAWTEVWLDDEGWVRVDPTAFVSPDRVEQGMNEVTQQQGAAMFGTGATAQVSYQQFRMMQALRRLSDQASYHWQKDIVGYDQDKQANALFKWLNITNFMQQLSFMVILTLIFLASTAFIIWYKRRKHWHSADLPLIQLSKRLAKQNPAFARADNEGILDWLNRLSTLTNHTQTQASIKHLQSTYRQLRYGKVSQLDKDDKTYQNSLKTLQQLTKSIQKLKQ